MENNISVYFILILKNLIKKILDIDGRIIILIKLISVIFEYTKELTSVIDFSSIYK